MIRLVLALCLLVAPAWAQTNTLPPLNRPSLTPGTPGDPLLYLETQIGAALTAKQDVGSTPSTGVGSFSVQSYGALGAGADDTAGFKAAFAAALASPHGGTIYVPPGTYNISDCWTATVGTGQSLDFGTVGSDQARLNFAPGLACSPAISIIHNNSDASNGAGGSVSVHGLEFNAGWTGIKATALLIQEVAGAQAVPSVFLDRLTFLSTPQNVGWWTTAVDLETDNVVRARSLHCFSMQLGSTCLKQDIPGSGGLAVDHDFYDLYAQGATGGTGVALGTPSTTRPLQGFTFNRISCTGLTNCIVAQTAGAGAGDELFVTAAQINATDFGIKAVNWDTVNVSSSYFLDNGTAVSVTGSQRTQVTGSTFYLGAPTSAPGNGTNNLGIVFNNDNGGPAGGSMVSSNLFTNNYGVTPAITLSGYTNYVQVVGNMALQGTVISDLTGNPSNTDFGNYQAGGIPGFNLGPLSMRARIDDVASNLRFTPPSGGNVDVNGPLLLASPDGLTGTIGTVANTTGVLNLNTGGLTLNRRIGNISDNPALMFNVATGGSGVPTIQYNGILDKFVFYNKNGAPIETLDFNGNAAFTGAITCSGGGSCASGGGGGTTYTATSPLTLTGTAFGIPSTAFDAYGAASTEQTRATAAEGAAAQKANNLSDLASAATARTNLGLAALAQQAFPAAGIVYSSGSAFSPLTIGTNLTLTGSTLSATSGGATFPGGSTSLVSGTGAAVTVGAGLTDTGTALSVVDANCNQTSIGIFRPECYGTGVGTVAVSGSGNSAVYPLDAAWNAAAAYIAAGGTQGASLIVPAGLWSECNAQAGLIVPKAVGSNGGLNAHGQGAGVSIVNLLCPISRSSIPSGYQTGTGIAVSNAMLWMPVPTVYSPTNFIWNDLSFYANGNATYVADLEGSIVQSHINNDTFSGASGDGTALASEVKIGNSGNSGAYTNRAWAFQLEMSGDYFGSTGTPGSGATFTASVNSGSGVPTVTVTAGGSGYSANTVVYLTGCPASAAPGQRLSVTVNGSGAITAVTNPSSYTFYGCGGVGGSTVYAHAWDPIQAVKSSLVLDNASDSDFEKLQLTTGTYATLNVDYQGSGSNRFEHIHPCCFGVPNGVQDSAANNVYYATEMDSVGLWGFLLYGNSSPRIDGTVWLWNTTVPGGTVSYGGAQEYLLGAPTTAPHIVGDTCDPGLYQTGGGFAAVNYTFASSASPQPGYNVGLMDVTICDGSGTVVNVLPGATALSPLQVVSNTYVAAGAIAVTDTLSELNPSAATTYTLANGTVGGHSITLSNINGSSTATVTVSSYYGTASFALTIAPGAVRNLYWNAASSTYRLFS